MLTYSVPPLPSLSTTSLLSTASRNLQARRQATNRHYIANWSYEARSNRRPSQIVRLRLRRSNSPHVVPQAQPRRLLGWLARKERLLTLQSSVTPGPRSPQLLSACDSSSACYRSHGTRAVDLELRRLHPYRPRCSKLSAIPCSSLRQRTDSTARH